jgi:hypothetical protein
MILDLKISAAKLPGLREPEKKMVQEYYNPQAETDQLFY